MGTEAILAGILGELESESSDTKKKCDAYDKISRLLTGDDVPNCEQEVLKNIDRLFKVIKEDVKSSFTDIKKKSLQLLGTCIFDTEIVSYMGKAKCESVLDILLATINSTKEKSTCSIALWCLKSQNMDDAIISDKVEDILSTIEFAMEKWSASSVSVVDGFIGTVERLTSQAPKQMCEKVLRWGRLLVPLIVNKAVQVRETALAVIETNMNTLKSVQKELVLALKPAMKQKVLPDLKELFKENRKMSVYVVKCWGILIYLYGEELHTLPYINQFMAVIELGFKSTEPSVKIAAFQAWQKLIDNFALNQSVIQDPKKIGLIMQVFKHHNTRTEPVAIEKLSCWWHFLWLLGDKVSPNFEQVADPLLNFCAGGKQAKQSVTSTPRSMPLSSTQPTFKSLQLLGCEALAHFLGSVEEGKDIHHTFKLDPFLHKIVTGPSFYIKHSETLITAASRLCTSLGDSMPDGLALHCWEWLVTHLKTAIDSPGKLDIRKTLSILLLEFRTLVRSNSLPNSTIMTIFERLGSIQKRVLCSSAYSIQGEEMINGTPALFITRLLLSPTLLMTCSSMDSFHNTFSFLLESGAGNSTGVLGFLQSVIEMLRENVQHVDHKESLCRLWTTVQHVLVQHVSKTNEINQGDSLEHDFGCSVQTLVFPVLNGMNELSQPHLKAMMKSWSELYQTVNRVAALVASAETNIVCEEVCSQILAYYHGRTTVEPTEIDILVQMCKEVVTSLYFSSLGDQPIFKMSVSPKKFSKSRHKPLGNIHSVITLLGLLQRKTTSLVPECENIKKTTRVSLQLILNNLVETFSTIFVHVTSSNVISNLIGELARPIGELITDSQNKVLKVYNNPFQAKLEKLWLDICTCLQSRYTSLFDSHFLEKLSPLLEPTFLHPRRQIKNQTMSLWNCTFGKAAHLQYPESLKPVLSKVKSKSMIELPSWLTTASSPVIDETPVSQMTQGLAPEPRIPGMPSPHKIYGSFLNKSVSPTPKSSPVRKIDSPVLKSSEKKKLDLSGFDDKDFVLIKPALKKKMVLTEHQREVLKEKSAIPAMYNGLEHSMDASLMAAHFTTDSQMDGSLSENLTPTLEPVSLFGSMIPPTNPEKKDDAVHKEDGQSNSKQSKTDKKGSRSVINRDSYGNDSNAISNKSDKTVEIKGFENKVTRLRSSKDTNDITAKSKQKKEIAKPMESQNSCFYIEDELSPDDEMCNMVDYTDNGNEVETMEVEMDTSNKSPGELSSTGKLGKFKASIGVSKKDLNTSSDHIDIADELKISSDKFKTDTDKSKKTASDDSNKTIGSSLPGSVPQNALGVMDYFQSCSSNASKYTKDGSLPDGSAGTDSKPDIDDVGPVSKDNEDKITESEKSMSQPLQSWTKKLNELSNSPLPASPLSKFSSQNSVVSPSKKTRSSKSPKRNKKKLTSENEEKRTLEKWIIRSPGKMQQSNRVTISQTLVEETQSPTKFASEKLKDKMSSSILETPPKNVLENITMSHSNSNRKLFPSQSVTEDFMVEDSNLVPASPNSQSFRVGTPILKLKKLSQEDILRYSPLKTEESEAIETVIESSQLKSVEKSKRAFGNFETVNSENPESKLTNNSKHEHDDFSVFTPLESEMADIKTDNTFSKSLSGIQQDLLDNENMCVLSGSENLFSQCDTDSGTNKEEVISNDRKGSSVEEMDVDINKENSEKDISARDMNTTEINKELNKTDTNNTREDDHEDGEIKANLGRGRRKQITPKKLTPEEKKPKKKNDEDTKNEVKGVGKRSRKQAEKSRSPVNVVKRGRKGKKLPEITSPKQTRSGKRKRSTNVSADKVQKKGKVSDKNEKSDIVMATEELWKNINDSETETQNASCKIDTDEVYKSNDKALASCNGDNDQMSTDVNDKSESSGVKDVTKLTDSLGDTFESSNTIANLGKETAEDNVSAETDGNLQNGLECKTDGTMDFDNKVTDKPDECKEKDESVNEVTDVSDDGQIKMNDNPLSQSVTASETNGPDNSFSDDDIPIAEIKRNMLKENNELEKTDVTAQNTKLNVRTKRTGLKKTDKVELETDIRSEETPRKEEDISNSSVAVRLMIRHSDSKLTYRSRKFEKKGGAARRSILKPNRSNKAVFADSDSPQRKPFHPITVGRIYSPTASPSASILKSSKRKWSQDETESPPAKQRRVSFATPLADVTHLQEPSSPLVKQSGKHSSQESGSLPMSGKLLNETQSTQGSPSQRHYESSLESQMNSAEPVCPELIGCVQSVEKILPQLMASSWSKGLSNLVRARNIHTIGDLSSLSENDIHNLPIRSPKVDTVKRVLTKFGKNIGSLKLEKQTRSNKASLDSPLKAVEDNPVLKPAPANTAKGLKQPNCTVSSNKETENPLDVLSLCNDLVDQSESQDLTDSQSKCPKSSSASKISVKLKDALLDIGENEEIDVQSLSANELIKLSQNLTGMLSQVNNALGKVVSTRCSSPWR